MIQLMRNEDPDDDRVHVLQKQNEMRVHDVEAEVERPHRVED